VFEPFRRRFFAILVLDEAIGTAGSGHFIQNSSKLDYFYSLVATSPANHIENLASNLWFVEYSTRLRETLSLSWFWMKKSQRQGAAILFKIIVLRPRLF
jgi:hypothetical protein